MNKTLPAMLIALSLVAQAAEPDASVMQVQREADPVWRDAAPGIRMAVLYGNPAAPEPYVVRARFAPGAMSPPHFHPEERQVVVLKGTWWVGPGPKWDAIRRSRCHPAASRSTTPARCTTTARRTTR